MTALAPTLQAWFTEHLIGQRGASPHTVAAYRDCLSLLVTHLHQTSGVTPSDLDFAHLDDAAIGGFLDHLEHDRGVSVATRNARLAAVRSLFRYASFRHPEHADLIARVLAIPTKKATRTDLNFLNDNEVTALLGAPDLDTWTGRRDHAWLLLMIVTGIRVSELVNLHHDEVSLTWPAHIVVLGKARKQRTIPIDRATAAALNAWTKTKPSAPPDGPLFPARGSQRVMSVDTVAQRLNVHTQRAADDVVSLATKNVTPHTLRHTCAMRMLAAGIDITTISLWLGHASPEATRHYLHADLGLKQRALERTAPPRTRTGRYQPTDATLAFLQSL
jgi:integrase/recombinase XerD